MNEKNISTWYWDAKQSANNGEHIFWIFKDFHGVMRVQSQTCIPARKITQWRR